MTQRHDRIMFFSRQLCRDCKLKSVFSSNGSISAQSEQSWEGGLSTCTIRACDDPYLSNRNLRKLLGFVLLISCRAFNHTWTQVTCLNNELRILIKCDICFEDDKPPNKTPYYFNVCVYSDHFVYAQNNKQHTLVLLFFYHILFCFVFCFVYLFYLFI